ncbi:DUF397 domain-containing protein [Nocardiopsis sp. CNT-189]|uniref:DUF397 domain-containing protein n=1 Tax=Nocardiopsis oceanisediminis TaxID=2816862 RepID=UPI003B343248
MRGDQRRGWHTSSYSGANTNTCVEVSEGFRTLIRDSENRRLGHLEFPAGEWAALVADIDGL